MKKNLTILLILLIFVLINSSISFGSSSTTYLYMEAIKITDPDIEILSDEIFIDTTTSKIKNTINLKNTSDKEKELNLSFPIENNRLEISVKDLVIKLNGVKVEYVSDNEGNYQVKTKISANSGKKIDIEYYTENDLQKAKLIKCNFDNMKGKKVGKLKVDIKIDEKNIPLVEKIYPGHYTFEDNTISVEYYNYEVNAITKDIIVEKETFNNLLYGRENDIEDEDKDIIKSWYTDGSVKLKEDYYTENDIVQNIIDYKEIKTGKNIDKMRNVPSEPLLYSMYKVEEEIEDTFMDTHHDLEGKKICIDFVETEGDKELYVDVGEYEGDDYMVRKLVKRTERNILQTELTSWNPGKRGAKIIFVGQGINGENLNATEQEKVSYINQINADMYIRIMIYDGKVKEESEKKGTEEIGDGLVGYYDDNNSEIVKAFAIGPEELISKEEFDDNSYLVNSVYSNYDQYTKNYFKDYYKNTIIKLDNEDIANKCEIPTVAQFIGYRTNQDGKYVVNYFFDSGFYEGNNRGLITTKDVLQTAQAKQLLEANKQKNANAKKEVENEISNLPIVDDEQKIQQDIKNEINEAKKQATTQVDETKNEAESNADNTKNKMNNKDIIVFAGIGLGIIVCIAVIIIERKKR